MVKKTIRRTTRLRKIEPCSFCKENKVPSFHNVSVLRRFLTERNKIIPRGRSGLCARHQKALAKNIKYARHLALLPFVPG